VDTLIYNASPKPAEPLRRMRVRKGRVMHLVEPAGKGWLRSKCRKPHPVKGVNRTEPRVQAYEEDWTDKRLWYPDCKHCPTNETKEINP
jgi:hypothetical protein